MSAVKITDDQREMARAWYGYGRWEAPYWFVGLEPGGGEIEVCARMWRRLGKGELLDIVAHHEEHKLRWFDENSRTQPTWARLIWLILAYDGRAPSTESTLEYQRRRLGRLEGETALIELSCVPALHNRIEAPRELFRAERVQRIRQRLLEHAPRFVVFYSPDPDYLPAWQGIAGLPLERDIPAVVGETVCVVTSHPIGALSRAYWTRIGEQLRGLTIE
jgi:hypothetical protein